MAYSASRPGSNTGRAWIFAICLGAGLSLSTASLHAAVVYKFLDADGSVVYSASPPPVPLRFEIIDIPDRPDTLESDKVNYDEIRDMAAQLEKDRKQREQARAAAREAQEQIPSPGPSPQPSAPLYFYPVYPPFYNYRHHSYPRHRSVKRPKPLPRRSPLSPSPTPR